MTYQAGREFFVVKKIPPPPNEEQISFKNKDQMKKCPGFNSYKHS